MAIEERKHRLPKEFYKGTVSVAFTLCLKRGATEGHGLGEPEIVRAFTDILASVMIKEGCIVPVYCFMPDHQHLIITGVNKDSDIWRAVVSYKQKTGFWMSTNNSRIRWQKDFYDHVIRRDESIMVQVTYLLNNPVRKGLVSSWEEYPFIGSVGCKLEDILNGII
jgi:REP element-mobilizing transposase RayT